MLLLQHDSPLEVLTSVRRDDDGHVDGDYLRVVVKR